MAAGESGSKPREGPFTVLSGMTGVVAIVVAAVTLLLPTARLVAGGVLVGIAIGVVGTWAVGTRARRARMTVRVLVPLVTASCGMFLLLAPTFLTNIPATSPPTEKAASTTPTPQSALLTPAPGASPTPTFGASPGSTGTPTPGVAPTASADLPDQYLADLTSNRNDKTGQMSGSGYQFAHGFAQPSYTVSGDTFVVPSHYQSLVATLKAVGGTIRFGVFVDGAQVYSQTISASQPAVTITCAVRENRQVVVTEEFAGNGNQADAQAVWGDAKFSPLPAPTKTCS